jgi:hypothetical protein
MECLEGAVEIGDILQHLHANDCIKLRLPIGWRHRVRVLAFHPPQRSAAGPRGRDLVRADVDGTDAPGGTHTLGHLIGIEAATTADI